VCVTSNTFDHRDNVGYRSAFSASKRSCPIPFPRSTSISAARAMNVAVGLVEQQEERLHAVMESKLATPDEKFQALVDLAHLAGILLHEMTEDEEIPIRDTTC
jgi:hypothetical protein